MLLQHEIKKIRNSLLKSGPGKKKNITHKGRSIHWQHWIDAYNWDGEFNPMKLHHRLTNDHMYPDMSAKMRNSLADEVLNGDMLHLMEVSVNDIGLCFLIKQTIIKCSNNK